MGEFIGFTVLALVLKAFLDLTIWRYAGPVSLIMVLICLTVYMNRRGISLARIGVVRLKTAKSYWLLPVQTVVAFVLILATGVVVSLIGEASGLAFMESNHDGATARFGDVAGNTSLFLFLAASSWHINAILCP
ncbi:MAG: hypothetical protein NXH88_02350 [Hyphomonas sp.]|nr:hypothetical protein [Hyphomonas sp.]